MNKTPPAGVFDQEESKPVFGKTLILAGGLCCAAGMSQFPEFSHQYTQRLSGAVDELRLFVEDFDTDAASLGLDRETALTQLAAGGALGTARAGSMERTIARYQRLDAALMDLRDADPFQRARHVTRLNDLEIARAAWEDFKPAVPLTLEGAAFSGVGFLGGMLSISLFFGLLRLLFGGGRRRRRTA